MFKQKHDNGFPVILLVLTLLFAVNVNKKSNAADNDDQFKLGEF